MYKVMIVDDEPVIKKGLISFIDWKGLNCQVVCEAENGLDAKAFLNAHSIDIVVTDIKMPGLDGNELSKYIYEHHPHIKIIILTAYADFSYAQTAIKYKVVDFIIKTKVIEKIPEALRKAIQLIQTEKENDNRVKRLEDLIRGLENYCLITFKIEDIGANETKNPEIQNRYMLDLQGILDVALKPFQLHTFILNSHSICAVISVSPDVDVAMKQELLRSCDEIVAMVDQFMAFTVSYGISNEHKKLSEMADAFGESVKATEETVVHVKQYGTIVYEAKQYVQKRYCEDIGLQSIADHIHVNSSYLSRVYKKETGESVIDTINKLRIEKAKKLLKEPSARIYEVATAVGITDPAYFTRVFIKYTGMSPKEYKLQGKM